MNANDFYQRITLAAAQPPDVRHRLFSAIHAEVAEEYQQALRAITPARAGRVVTPGTDNRTLAQVVGHITAWEQFAILACGDILAGVRHPRMITTVEGYIDTAGKTHNFPGIDAFNTYHAQLHTTLNWTQIQSQALDTAGMLEVLFTHPLLLSAERLEQTEPFRKRMQNGEVINNITMGWNLWITVLEHEAVEHAKCLYIKG